MYVELDVEATFEMACTVVFIGGYKRKADVLIAEYVTGDENVTVKLGLANCSVVTALTYAVAPDTPVKFEIGTT